MPEMRQHDLSPENLSLQNGYHLRKQKGRRVKEAGPDGGYAEACREVYLAMSSSRFLV